MFEPLFFLLLLLIGFYVWQSALRARERARLLGRALCAEARVQLLDQTVALSRLRLRRVPGRGLRLWRCFAFEFSSDGIDRLHGSLDLLDDEVVAYDLPVAGMPSGPGASAASGGNVIELRPRERPH